MRDARNPDDNEFMRPTVSDRLRARGCLLVGRHAELRRAQELLTADQRPAVLHVHGPGGVGKTAYLREVERCALERARPTRWIDCDELDGTTGGVLAALGAPDPAELAEVLPSSAVIFIDRLELLAPLERWFWRDLVLALPSDAFLVVAGRYPPRELDDRLRDAGLVEVLALRNLGRADAASLLHARGLPESIDVDALLDQTHGHPLALVIAADAFSHGEVDAIPASPLGVPPDHPDAAAGLIARFVDDVDDPLQRRALHVAGHVRRVDRVLLRVALGIDSPLADDLLSWLGDRPYAEVHPDGLALHDVVRDALDRDLWWRDPDGYEAMHSAIRDVIIRRLRHGEDHLRLRAATDLLYLHQRNPATHAMYDYQDLGRCAARPALPSERATVIQLVDDCEGTLRGEAAAQWFDAQPPGSMILLDPAGKLLGVALVNRLDTAPELQAVDPVAAAAWDHISRRRPPGPGERVVMFQAVNPTYPERARSVNDVCAVLALTHYSEPGVGWVVHASRNIDQWEPLWAYIGFEELVRVPLADGSVVSVWARDFVRTPFEGWLAEMRRRELDHNGTLRGPVPAPVAWPQADFEQHARALLRDFHRPERFASNELVRSELVDAEAFDSAAEQLRAAVVEAVAQVEEDPATERAARAVDRTYLRRTTTQEAAAEVLEMPFSTYRRQLAKGMQAVVTLLWTWETRGGQRVNSL